MRILILGGDGMLGHELLRSWRDRHGVTVTVHGPLAGYRAFGLFSTANTIDRLDIADRSRVTATIRDARPDAIVNCVGIVKQRSEAKAAIPSIAINALWPHELLEICRAQGARLVHMSTDCVFSGRRGRYTEQDTPDPIDLYGRSKLLGEVSEAPGLTLRTSIIGLELSRFTGLVEWFLAQRGIIRGFRRAIYTGFTTSELARIIERLLVHHSGLHGVWQVASAPISKHDLLVSLARLLNRSDVKVEPDDEFACDRSLEAGAFAAATGYAPPTWDAMLAELAEQIRGRGPRPAEPAR